MKDNEIHQNIQASRLIESVLRRLSRSIFLNKLFTHQHSFLRFSTQTVNSGLGQMGHISK